jgi:hypothetical protein
MCVFSQTTLQVYSVSSGPWNPYTQKFDLQTTEQSMTIYLENSVIRLTDRANSVYIVNNSVIEQNDYNAVIASWDAVDEKARRCKIFMGMNKSTGIKSMIVTYNDYMLQYFHY